MITVITTVLHVIAAGMLILLILLHSGKGGGLSDMFGGMGNVAAGSTVVERNLDRVTVGVAIVFAFTTTILGLRLQ